MKISFFILLAIFTVNCCISAILGNNIYEATKYETQKKDYSKELRCDLTNIYFRSGRLNVEKSAGLYVNVYKEGTFRLDFLYNKTLPTHILVSQNREILRTFDDKTGLEPNVDYIYRHGLQHLLKPEGIKYNFNELPRSSQRFLTGEFETTQSAWKDTVFILDKSNFVKYDIEITKPILVLTGFITLISFFTLTYGLMKNIFQKSASEPVDKESINNSYDFEEEPV